MTSDDWPPPSAREEKLGIDFGYVGDVLVEEIVCTQS